MTDVAGLLKEVTALSHEFGGADYLKGGGGNTSAKNAETLWIKPSGTTLLDIRPDDFVAMDRAKLGRLYEEAAPKEPTAREAWVKEKMMAAVRDGASGRPSVEAPLHNLFDATFVVHTHPALVNGMTSGKNGREACGRLFPDALWVDYTDPGYTICMAVMGEMKGYRQRRGHDPGAVFLGNHGVFVGGDSASEMRETYGAIKSKLRREYEKAGVSMEFRIAAAPVAKTVEDMKRRILGLPGMEGFSSVAGSGPFRLAERPISPDQIVYMRSYPLVGEPTAEAVGAFIAKRGYAPRVIACGAGIFGVGTSDKNAALALELAQDSGFVCQLAEAFGGIQYMTDEQGNFIDKWEVEAYRRKMAK